MMTNLITNHSGLPFREIDIQTAVNSIKNDIENAIIANGTKGKNDLIKTQKPIKLIHDVIKTELFRKGVDVSLINPDIKQLQKIANPTARRTKRILKLKDKELQIAGYLKLKKQDVSAVPKDITVLSQILNQTTMLEGEIDRFGYSFTEAILSINIRSQLSSTDKNFDTLYERTFAEALNLHLRCPKIVLGELYMIIAKEYNEDDAKVNAISFKNADNIEKYIKAFQALNGRMDEKTDLYKYERNCLLIVDFSAKVPKIYSTDDELKQDGLLPRHSTATIKNLTFHNFVSDLLLIHEQRFGKGKFS